MAIVAIVFAAPVSAMSIRDDTPQSDYENQIATSPFSATGRFNTNHSGSLIGWRWVLLSAHGGDASTFVTVNGSASVQQRIVYPGDASSSDAFDGLDFALMKLVDPILTVDPVQIYTGSASSLNGQTVVYAGGGRTGTGDVGANGPRALLAGTNIVDNVGIDFGEGVISNVVASDFDNPSARPSRGLTTLEMGLASGDSGGGLYVDVGGTYQLAGVHSGVTDPDEDGVLGEYGHLNLSTILTNPVRDWINTLAGPQLTWTGAQSSEWDSSTTNFDSFGSASAFQSGSEVLFDDTASQFTVNVTEPATQKGMVINTAGAYVFAGSAAIGGSGDLYKTGTGSLELASANAFTGGAVVDAGTLIVTNTNGSATGSGAVTVRAGAVLGGSGTIGGQVVSSGTVQPDGTLSVGGYEQLPGASLAIELATTNSDQLAVTGGVTLSGGLDLSLDAGYTPSIGDSFTLISASSISGQFDMINGIPLGVVDGVEAGLAVLYDATTVSARASILGDANADDVVNGTDLALLAANFGGNSGMNWATGDFNGDGLVNGTDLALLAANFGFDATAAAVPIGMTLNEASRLLSTVPEPSTMLLLGIGYVALCRRRR